ncbi:MAG TPA: tetratricopeptide repeat protein [Pyrinomonadaceae bacterium]|jgi:tetratricopeptide (TPR) repeat protein
MKANRLNQHACQESPQLTRINQPRRRVVLSLCLLGCLALVGFSTASGQQQRRRAGRSRTTTATTAASGAPQTPASQTQPVSQQDFDKLVAEANAAREGDRVDEAIGLYRKAIGAQPQWAEGWWYLATLYYDRNNYTEAARAFAEAARLQPKAGAVWAMLGLCEFQLERYDDALTHIQQGRSLGIGDNVELTRVMRYHEGILSTYKGEFERAQQTLGTLSFEGLKSEDLIIGLGLSVLRMAMLPKQVDINYRDRAAVRRAGMAEHFSAQKNVADATREYELLAKDYPTFPNAQYAYGRFLLGNRDDEGAIAAFERELKNSPKHALARIQIAYVKLRNKEAAAGLPLAEEAVKLYPRLPLGHYILGRLLFDVGQNARAIEELELAGRMVPTEPKIYFALTRAYSKANRKADADRARETFTRLNQQAEAAAGRGETSGSALPEDNAGSEQPAQPK